MVSRRVIWVGLIASACGGPTDGPLPVTGSLSIVQARLPVGIVGQPYQARIETSGAMGDVEIWEVMQGRLPKGLVLQPSETRVDLMGEPEEPGTFSFSILAQDASGDTATALFTVAVDRAPPPLRLQVLRRTLQVSVDEFYLLELEATGGSGTGYQWFVTDLPSGLRKEPLGPRLTVLGQPESGGRLAFDVILTDPTGSQALFQENTTVAYPELRIATDALPSGAVGVPYQAQIRAIGGSAVELQWSLGESPPPGLHLDTSARGPVTTLTGTPQVPGQVSFEAVVQDSSGQRAKHAFEFEIVEGRPGIFFETALLPGAFVTVPYSAPLRAQGGTPPYEFGFEPGSEVPSGIDLVQGPNGAELTGTPFQSGLFKLHMWVQDSTGLGARRTLDLQVKTPPLKIDTDTLPDGRMGQEYRAPLETVNTPEGGLRWYLTQGELPRGLTLPDSGSPRNVVIGLPMESGEFEVTVAVTSVSSNQFDIRSYKFRIDP